MKKQNHSSYLSLFSLGLSLSLILSGLSSLEAQSTPSAAKAGTKMTKADKTMTNTNAMAGASSAVIPLKDPVAIVNGAKISKQDLEKAFKTAVASSGMNPATITPEQKMQAYRQILDGLIMEKIVDEKSASLKVSDAEVKTETDKIKQQFAATIPNFEKLSGEEQKKQLNEAFAAELKKSGQTEDQLTANIKKSIRQTEWVKSQIQGKDQVTDEEAQKFYNDNIKQFAHPEMVKATHILFVIPQGAPDSIVKAKEAAAKAAIVRANKGEDFSKLAIELSEEPGAKQRAGDLGFFSKDQMVPEFATAAFSQKAGSVSVTPIKTKFGYHVIKVTEKKPAGTISFAEAKPNIIAYLQNQKRREALKNLMQQLRQGSKVEIFLPAPPAMPTPAANKTATNAPAPATPVPSGKTN